MSGRACAICDHFDGDQGGGICRRYAPKPVVIAGGDWKDFDPQVYWPEVHADDFCGEWKQIK